MLDDCLIKVDNVSKKFCRNFRKSLYYGVADIAGELSGRRNGRNLLRPQEFWAVRNVSFDVQRGDCVGIIGRNGAGKSTLMKLIQGKIKLDDGHVRVRGKIAAISELGVGFNPVQTGRENVYNAAAVYGMSRKETDRHFEEIVDFAGVEDFIDSPVQNYSSGMRARLGYAVMTHLNPDILLIDEVLAVGDQEFRRKCFRNLLKFRDNGGVLIIVAHEIYFMQAICNRCLVMDQGRATFTGDIIDGISFYLQTLNLANDELTSDQLPKNAMNVISKKDEENLTGLKEERSVTIESVQIRPCHGTQIETGSRVEILLEYQSSKESDAISWGFTITTADQAIRIASGLSGYAGEKFPLTPGKGQLMCTIPNLPLLPGNYCLRGAVLDADGLPMATFGWQGPPSRFSVTQSSSSREDNVHLMIGALIKMDILWR